MIVPSEVRELLTTVGCDDLYGFLELKPKATPSQLRAAAEKEYNRVQNKGLRGPKWDARKRLAGLCVSTIFKNDDTKRDYDRALTEAKKRGEAQEGRRTGGFDEATALLETGMGFVRRGSVKDAVVIAKRLTGDYPEYSRFRMTVGGLLLSGGRHLEAIDFLSWCVGEEPNNNQYTTMLGTVFARLGTASWDQVNGTSYATRAEHVSEAEQCLSQARAYAKSAASGAMDLHMAIAELEAHLKVATRRRWNGSKLAAVAGGVVGLVWFTQDVTGDGTGTLMLASAVVYAVSSIEPQWKINATALKQPEGAGCLWYIVKAGLTVAFLPFVAGWKFVTNFWPAYRNHPAVGSARAGFGRLLQRIAASLGRRVFALVAVGLLAVGAVGILPSLSTLIEPPIEPGNRDGPEVLPAGEGDDDEAGSGEPARRRETPRPREASTDVGGEPAPVGNPAQAGSSGEAEGEPVVPGAEGGTENGGSVVAATAPDPRNAFEPVPEQQAATTTAGPQQPVRVGGNVTAPTKVVDVQPVYPAAARRMRVEGIVILETVIGATGSVEQVRVLRSVPLLDEAAVEAVRQWRYTPTLLNGLPVPVVMSVTVNFTLQ